MNLTTATPVEVDTAIAEVYGRYYKVLDRVTVAGRDVKYMTKRLAEPGTYVTQDKVDRAIAVLDEYKALAASILDEADPLEAEYGRRPWTRAFLVTNSNGHVHNTMACGTCYPTTRFAWLTEYSGHDESEVVAAAGEQACTVCYPSAPVEGLTRKSTIELPDKRAARLEREAKRAAKDAKRAASALFADDPDRFVRVDYDRLGTIAAAKSWLTTGFVWGWDHPSYGVPAQQVVAQALAARTGDSVEVVLAAAEKRAAKRR